jgi:hypothetical protein
MDTFLEKIRSAEQHLKAAEECLAVIKKDQVKFDETVKQLDGMVIRHHQASESLRDRKLELFATLMRLVSGIKTEYQILGFARCKLDAADRTISLRSQNGRINRSYYAAEMNHVFRNEFWKLCEMMFDELKRFLANDPAELKRYSSLFALLQAEIVTMAKSLQEEV